MTRVIAVGILCLLVADSLVSFGQVDTDLPVVFPTQTTTYDIDQGLPASCVLDPVMDQQGRLWLNACYHRTEYQGIDFYQYDGYQSQTVAIQTHPDGQHVQAIVTGSGIQGKIFGFYRETDAFFLYDPADQQTQIFSLTSSPNSDLEIMHIALDGSDGLFIYAIDPLNHLFFQWQHEEVEKLGQLERLSKETPKGDELSYVYQDKHFWFFNKEDTDSTRFDFKRPGFPTLKDRIGPLIQFDQHNRSFRHYDLTELVDKISNKLSIPFLYGSRNIQIDAAGKVLMYFSMLGEFYQLDPTNGSISLVTIFPKNWSELDQGGKFSTYRNMIKDKVGNLLIWNKNIDNEFNAILQDSSGQWYDYRQVANTASATSRYTGGHIFTFSGQDFRRQILAAMEGGLAIIDVKLNSAIQSFASNMATRSIVEFSSNKFWFKSDCCELFEIDMLFQGASDPLDILECQEHDIGIFSDFVKDASGNIWLPNNNLLLKYNHQQNVCEKYMLSPDFGSFYKFIQFDSTSFLMVQFEKNDLFIYDTSRDKLSALEVSIPLPETKDIVNDIHLASDNTLWIATLEGLWKIDPSTGNSQTLGLEDGFSDKRMMCIQEDKLGRLWIGSMMGGVHIYDPETTEIDIVDKNDGLSNNTVIGLLEDEDGDFWASTYNGINLISSKGELLTHLYEEDGLSTNEFNRFSYYKSSDGKLLFGSIAGINVIDPNVIKQQLFKQNKLQIYLTELSFVDQTSGKETTQFSLPKTGQSIQIPANAKFLKLKFALSSYVAPERNQYAYQIEHPTFAQTDTWTNIGNIPELSLSNLPSGKYNVLIRASDYKGNWVADPLVIPVDVGQFFYKQWWFYALILLLISSIAIAWILRERSGRLQLEKIVADRTRKIRQDKQLIEQQAQNLKEMDELKSRFFTNISHEFRTPLTLILGQLHAVNKDSKQKDSRLSMALRNAKQLLRLINQLLDLSKIDAHQMQLRASKLELVPFLRQLTSSFESIAQERKLKLVFEADTAPISIYAEQDKMEKIMNNLLSNAMKFTPEGGKVLVRLKLEDFPSSEKNEGDPSPQEAIITVRDSGVGIPSDRLPHIFNRFFQVDSSTTREYEGTGVGLALTKELIQLHGGGISVDSREGFGTTFTVRLPLGKAHLEAEQIVEQTQVVDLAESPFLYADPAIETIASSNEDPETPLVLIVEDNADMRAYIRQSLVDRYRIVEASNGETGYQQAQESIPDLIITDVMMPKMDGYELSQQLRTNLATNHIPIIMLTAKAADADRFEGIESGVDVFLTKPFSTQELAIRIRKLIENRSMLLAKIEASPIRAASSQMLNSADQVFLDRLLEIAEANLADDGFHVPELCQEIGLSSRQLLRKLKALLDISPSHYLRQLRLERAKQMLEAKEGNVIEIAMAVGFSNHASFTRAFSQAFGMPPSEVLKD